MNIKITEELLKNFCFYYSENQYLIIEKHDKQNKDIWQ